MQLDFFTLYIVILLYSITLSIVWGAAAHTYRSFSAARYWFLSCLMMTAGGLILAFEGLGLYPLAPIAGNTATIFGFHVMWLGGQRFSGVKPRWSVAVLLTLISLVVMIAVSKDRPVQNVVYAVGQSVPIVLAIWSLISLESRNLGAKVAVFALITALLGQGMEALLNLIRLAGSLSTEGYYGVAAYSLLAIIFGIGIWNIGFILMAFDRLRGEMEALAGVDELTGLPNRRELMRVLKTLETHGRRTGKGFSVLLIDVDDFKAINDRFGHAAGDSCLRHIALVSRKELGEANPLVRVSGDEFCAVLPGMAAAEAGHVAGRLVRAIAAEGHNPWQGQVIPLSISVGVAGWNPKTALDIAQTLEAADMALYEAKRNGKNGSAISTYDRPPLAETSLAATAAAALLH